MAEKINDSIYTIKVRLPKSPLRDLNSYVICTQDRNLIIDTGFNNKQCLEDLMKGIEELGIDMYKTDILATHFHPDHCGLMDKIIKPGCKMYIGEIDKELLEYGEIRNYHWDKLFEMYGKEGFPLEILEHMGNRNKSVPKSIDNRLNLTPLKDGQILKVGHLNFKILHTPGHTPGHICLYNEEDNSLILGDHILFGITPNITVWPTMQNALGQYIKSLGEIKKYNVKLALTGHREYGGNIKERIDEIFKHHEDRLKETLDIIKQNPGIDAYNVASKMTWSMRGMTFENFPIEQRWFAMGEALAHLQYLHDKDMITSKENNSKILYY